MLDYFQILTAFVAVFLALYYYFTSKFDFWRNRGVIGPRPIPFFGNAKDVLLRKIGIGSFITELYKRYDNEAMFGIFISRSPNLVLRDLDLIKDVLIKDFSIFDNRGLNISERVRILFFICDSVFLNSSRTFEIFKKKLKFKVLSISYDKRQLNISVTINIFRNNN